MKRSNFATTARAAVVGIALAMGFWHGVLGLGYLYLLWIAWKRNGFTFLDLCLQGLLVALK